LFEAESFFSDSSTLNLEQIDSNVEVADTFMILLKEIRN